MDDFYISALRMWENANILKSNRKWFGACYLAGYVLECYGKILIEKFLPSRSARSYNHNIESISNDLNSLIPGVVPGAAKYCLDLIVSCNTICSGSQKWSPNKRYNNTSGFWDTETTADAYINEAQKVRDIITQMELDGVI